MDEQQLANQPVDPVAQAEEVPTNPTSEPQPETPSEPTPSVEDSPVSEPVPAPETSATPEEVPSIPVDQSEVFRTEYEALVKKTGHCLQVTPKFVKDEVTGVYDPSKFILEIIVAENK